jgi:hypothetical protein
MAYTVDGLVRNLESAIPRFKMRHVRAAGAIVGAIGLLMFAP